MLRSVSDKPLSCSIVVQIADCYVGRAKIMLRLISKEFKASLYIRAVVKRGIFARIESRDKLFLNRVIDGTQLSLHLFGG